MKKYKVLLHGTHSVIEVNAEYYSFSEGHHFIEFHKEKNVVAAFALGSVQSIIISE